MTESSHYRMKQMARIIKTAFKIYHQPAKYTRPALMSMFGVSKQTVQRDIDLLRDMGLVIRVDGKQGYIIESGFEDVFLPESESDTEQKG